MNAMTAAMMTASRRVKVWGLLSFMAFRFLVLCDLNARIPSRPGGLLDVSE